jgi:hypothetical protein
MLTLIYLIGKPEGKKTFGRHRHRWEGYIKMNFNGIGWEGVDWIHVDQYKDRWRAVANTIMILWVPKKAENFLG